MAIISKTFRMLLHPHYVFNILLSLVFYVMKTVPPICGLLFENCQLELREWELFTFLGCIIVLKNRKQPTTKVYIATFCMFAKIMNGVLFARQNPIYAVIYVLFCLLHLAFLPEPGYSGPENIVYFKGNTLEEELERDKRITWLIEFYAAWSPSCVQFAQTFSELSSKFSLDNLKFGKIDATRYPDIAAKYKVDTSSWSKQLPSLVLFQGGKESRRRPMIDAKGKVVGKFMFNGENIVTSFQMSELHLQCKKNPLKKKKSHLDQDVTSEDAVDASGKSKTE